MSLFVLLSDLIMAFHKNHRIQSAIFCICCLLLPTRALAQAANNKSFAFSSSYYQDCSTTATYQQVQAEGFTATLQPDEDCVLWQRIEFASTSAAKQQLLVHIAALVGAANEVDFYTAKGEAPITAGIIPANAALVEVAAEESALLYIRYRNFNELPEPGVSVYDQHAQQQHLLELLISYGAIGGIVVLVFYNLLLYVFSREKTFLFFLLSILFYTLFSAHVNGYLAAVSLKLPMSVMQFFAYCGYFSGTFYFLFSIWYLPKSKSKLYRLVRTAVITVAIFLSVASVLALLLQIPYFKVQSVLSVTELVGLSAIYGIAFYNVKRSVIAKLYLLAVSTLLPFLIVYLIQAPYAGGLGWFGLIESTAFTRSSLTIGTCLQGLAFTLALSGRSKLLESKLAEQHQLHKKQELDQISQQLAVLATERDQLAIDLVEKEDALAVAKQETTASKKKLTKLTSTRDKFLALLSHDLRGPIASFQVLSKIIQHQLDKGNTDRVAEIMFQVEKTATQLTSLLDNLLLWAQAETQSLTLRPKYLTLQPMIADIAATYASIGHDKEVEVKMKIPADLQLYADSPSVATILRNLIGNAMKFTEKGQITVTAFKKGNEAIVLVKDTGKGIKADKMKDLFEVGKKKSTLGTKGEQGNGLGLVLCYEFARKNKGNLSIKSAEGEGTTVRLALPATKW